MNQIIPTTAPVRNIGHTADFERRRRDLLQALQALVRSGSRAEMIEEVEATTSAMRQIVDLEHA